MLPVHVEPDTGNVSTLIVRRFEKALLIFNSARAEFSFFAFNLSIPVIAAQGIYLTYRGHEVVKVKDHVPRFLAVALAVVAAFVHPAPEVPSGHERGGDNVFPLKTICTM